MEKKFKTLKKISIIGPESSGKTTITKILAKVLNCNYCEEYARDYLRKRKNYKYDDLIEIGKGQNRIIKKSVSDNSRYFIADTSCIVVELWSKIKFKKVDEELYQLSKSENFDFYLLCKPDIPWEKDNLRENPEDRDKIFIEYEAVLKRRKLKYKIIKGSLIERLLTSLDFIKNKN